MATTIIEIKRVTTTTNIATSIKTIASLIKTITAIKAAATIKTTATIRIAKIKTKASTTIETIATPKIRKTKSNNNHNNSNNNNSSDKVLSCTFQRCNRVAASKAGLANHVRQKHQTEASIKCQYCGLNFKPQGIYNHKKKCSSLNPLHLPHGG